MKVFVLFLMLLSFSVNAASFDHEHQAFSQLLEDVVFIEGHQSRVDYPKLIQQRATLDIYLDSLSAVSKSTFDSFTREQQLAFLINAYNGYQLRQVIDHYPLKSIKDVGSFFSSPWSKEFFTLFGQPASLDMVEHQLIRPVFKEPRIHFAVNCASISCPPLMNQAYVASKLDEQLSTSAINFLNDSAVNYLKGNKLYVSKIFDWYEEDFPDGVIHFIQRYRSDLPNADQLKLTYSDYDWNLNQR